MESLSNLSKPCTKPINGFYTSTLDLNSMSTDWSQFMRAANERKDEIKMMSIITPNPTAKVYVINSIDDYSVLANQFPQHGSCGALAPNWNEIQSLGDGVIDAIHFTRAAVIDEARRGMELRPRFNAWNVESTLWLRPAFDSPVYLGNLDENWNFQMSTYHSAE